MPEAEMLAPCGLDCSRCAVYVAAQDPEAAQRLAEAWRANGCPDAQADWFRCQGCRGARSVRWCRDCRIAECCVEERGLSFCSECVEFPCDELRRWSERGEHHRQALEALAQMRQAAAAGTAGRA